MLINSENLNRYQMLFGREKMVSLWQEYRRQAEQDLAKLPALSPEEIRGLFHRLHASSQVFGLEEFADLCGQIEDNLVQKRPADAMIASVVALFNRSVNAADSLLTGKKHD